MHAQDTNASEASPLPINPAQPIASALAALTDAIALPAGLLHLTADDADQLQACRDWCESQALPIGLMERAQAATNTPSEDDLQALYEQGSPTFEAAAERLNQLGLGGDVAAGHGVDAAPMADTASALETVPGRLALLRALLAEAQKPDAADVAGDNENETLQTQLAMGVVLGDALAHHLGMLWVVVDDAHGRALALHKPDTGVVLFPQALFVRRLQSGEAVDVFAWFAGWVLDVQNALDEARG